MTAPIPLDESKLVLMLAYLCISQEAEASLERKVQILDRFDLTAAQIAKVCGVAVQSVHNARSTAKKTRK